MNNWTYEMSYSWLKKNILLMKVCREVCLIQTQYYYHHSNFKQRNSLFELCPFHFVHFVCHIYRSGAVRLNVHRALHIQKSDGFYSISVSPICPIVLRWVSTIACSFAPFILSTKIQCILKYTSVPRAGVALYCWKCTNFDSLSYTHNHPQPSHHI